MSAPKIDRRSAHDIAAQAAALVSEHTGWDPGPEPDAGSALIGVFSQYAKLVADQVNRIPDRSLLAYLNLIGVDMTPARSARVPLTFTIAADSPVDGFVPAGTQAAAPPEEGEADEVVFETEQDLVVTRSRLADVWTRHFDHDHAADLYHQVQGEPFPPFTGNQPVEHVLYVAAEVLATLEEPTDVTVRLKGPAVALLASLPHTWMVWDAEVEDWSELTSTAAVDGGDVAVTLSACPPVEASEVNGISGSWLKARLGLALPPAQTNAKIERYAVGDGIPVPTAGPTTIIEPSATGAVLYLGGENAFNRPGATVVLDVALMTAGTGGPAVVIDYKASERAGSEWQALEVVDGTEGLSGNGSIEVRVPDAGAWPITAHRGHRSRWLRVRVTGGRFGTAPVIGRLAVSHRWELPTLDSVAIDLPSDRAPIPATTGLLNGSDVEMSMDFFLFGDEPEYNDVFHLAYGSAYTAAGGQTGRRISIHTTMAQVGRAGSATLTWDYWNGRRWSELGRSSYAGASIGSTEHGFHDETLAFTAAAADGAPPLSIGFDLPPDAARVEVGGEEDHWLRVRLSAGDYGQDAQYIQRTDGGFDLAEATWQAPIVASMTFLAGAGPGHAVSALVTENDFQLIDQTAAAADPQRTFTPFVSSSDTGPTLYLGFDKAFANRRVTLYVAVAPPSPDAVLPDAMRSADHDDSPVLVWEYATTDGWANLGLNDATAALTDRGVLTFIGPADFASRERFGVDRYWIRARWIAGRYPVAPTVERFRLNTVWANQQTTFVDETLGSGDGEPAQLVETVNQPVQPGAVLRVREEMDEGTILELEAAGEATVIRDDTDVVDEVWTHWQEVPDFLTSRPVDRHYTLDTFSGRIRFGDGVQGMTPPPGVNNIRLTSYSTGGGVAGNRAPNTIVELKSTVPYVDEVVNHEPARGGAPQQSIEQVIDLGPRSLRHRDRAVTRDDVEDLAHLASADVARAKAVLPTGYEPLSLWLSPNRSIDDPPPDLTQHRDVTEAGTIGLIVVPNSTDERPAPGPELLRRVRSVVSTQLGATAQLWVSGPDWRQVSITASVVPKAGSAVDVVGQHVLSAIRRFLHPLTGGENGAGWPFGRTPHRSDLFLLIEEVPGADYVTELEVEIGGDPSAHALVFSGLHAIAVVPPLAEPGS